MNQQPLHIFISYASEDRRTALHVQKKLHAAGIPTWIDTGKLILGTPDWESSIRKALDQCFAVVLLASPSSRASLYVRGEIALAKAREKTVFPAWIKGEIWADSIPIDMIYAQYIDYRDLNDIISINQLSNELLNIIEQNTPSHYLQEKFQQNKPPSPPNGFISIEINLNNNENCLEGNVFFRINDYSNIQRMLDELYVNYLNSQFKPYTYGKDWVICRKNSGNLPEIIVPWSWLDDKNKPISELEPAWGTSTSLHDLRITNQSTWEIATPTLISPIGLIFEDTRLLDIIQRSPKARTTLIRDALKLSALDARKKTNKYIVAKNQSYLSKTPQSPDILFINNRGFSEEYLAEQWNRWRF